MKLDFSVKDVKFFFGLIRFKEKSSDSLSGIEEKQLRKSKDMFNYFKEYGKFNFSRTDINYLLDLIEFRRMFVNRPTVGELNHLFKLRDVLLVFRKSVWGEPKEEVDSK